MPDGDPIQTNFTSGEVSPLLKGRVDITRYFNGVQKLRNFLVKPQGGIVRRSGTRFVDTTKYPTELSVGIRFEFNINQSYILIFGRGYIWFVKNGAVIKITGTPVEVVTPYQLADLRDLYVTQSADVMYICHPSYPPKTLARTSDTVWTLADYVHKDGPYLDVDTRGYQMKLTNITNTTTLHDTNGDFTNSGLFSAVGKYVEYWDKNRKKIALVTAYTNSSTLTVTPLENIIFTEDLDPRCAYTYVAAAASNNKITIHGAPKTMNVDATVTIAANVITFGTDNVTYTLPALSVLSLASAWPARIRASVAVWSIAHEGCYIRLPSSGEWLLTASHLPQPEAYNATPGGTTSADIMTVNTQLSLVPQTLTGIISIDPPVRTATLTCSNAVFSANDVGRQVRLTFNLEQVWCTITAFTSSTVVTVTLGRMMPVDVNRTSGFKNDATTTTWRLGAWFTGNYPSIVTFHEERLCFFASPSQPQTKWMSKSSDYINFAPTDEQSVVADDAAITTTIASGVINSIVWAISSAPLLLGTIGSEWQVKASSLNQPITPTNINALEQTPYGSVPQFRPQKVAQAILFCQRSGNKIRELLYDYQFDSYVGKDLCIVSEHILRSRSGALGSAYQKDPNSTLWVICNNGDLVGMTYEKDQEVVAWHPHVLGGSFAGGNPQVLSITVVPSSDGKTDILYMTVKRTINGATAVYIEYFETEFAPSSPSDINNMFFVDCGLTYNGAPVSTVTGLNHLEGQTVQIVANGTYRGTFVVASGSVTFTGGAASVVQAGLAFNSVATVLPIESGSAQGTAQGKIKRIQRVILRLQDSYKFKVGPTEATVKPVSFKGINVTTDDPNLFTGDKYYDIDQSPSLDAVYSVVQDQPYPLTVIALMPQMQTNL